MVYRPPAFGVHVATWQHRCRGHMGIELIENEIRRFLASTEAEVICIRGRWGVGKTFAWNKYVNDARREDKFGLKRYSYVSLFGLTALDDLKFSIFENTVPSDKATAPSLATIKTNTLGVMEGLGRKTVWFAQQVPWVKSHVGGLGPVWFMSVKNTVICLDDFERRGERLPVRDVLGLVSTLKEQRGCKVVLILNDEALEADKADFDKYLEKVIDASLKFAPSAVECVKIALAPGTEASDLISESCLALGISNIRVIKKIERAVKQLAPVLSTFDKLILRRAVSSLALLGWSVFEPKLAPSLEFLEKKLGADVLGTRTKEKLPEHEIAWNALLDAYHWQNMDDFDRVLLAGTRDGFFDLASVEKHAAEIQRIVMAAKAHASFEEAWKMFHESFGENEKQLLEAVRESFVSTIEYRNPLDLNGTVWLLKKLGREAEAKDLISQYLTKRGAERRLFDLESYPFWDRIDEPDVIQAFKEKCATMKDERNPLDTLLSMAETHSWMGEDISMLSTLPVDEYYNMFRASNGQRLLDILNACLQFDRIVNATEPMREISRRAKTALKRIGEESPLNALRVRKYGIDV